MPRPPVLLRAAGVAVVLAVEGPGLPRILHWGADPGEGPADSDLLAALTPAVSPSALDEPWPFTLLPGQADGWSGEPGLRGHRDGLLVHPRFELLDEPVVTALPGGGFGLTCRAADPVAGLEIAVELRVEPSGLVRLRHEVTNTAAGTYTLDGLLALLPVPETATELLDLTGRWCRERSPQRAPFDQSARVRATRRGRPGHDAPLLLLAGSAGFGFRTGQLWGVHVAWSGNAVHLAEQRPEGAGAGGLGVIGGGELLEPGEIRLAPGETYASPWVLATWSDAGLDGASARIHSWLRGREHHPRTPRPLVLNSWEAVYFDHDSARLDALVDTAADIGVERFVLDDGWFRGRRDDSAGLGDWYVDATVWPDGLRPLADRVHGLGMQFGLWVEPEMVNPDSDLVRVHPDWLLAGPGREPRLWRRQLVLDVGQPESAAYLLERLDALVSEIGIDFLKWDHNRDLHEAVSTADAGAPRAGVHRQTLALYALLDELRRRHPGLEIESCASGGARVDLGILEHADRVWASDTNDALERQAIQRWTGLLLPPELVGAHVGPPVAHTTGRTASLTFRCLTALFGHAGLEWDVTSCSEAELGQLRSWGALYKQLRGLLHSGEVVHVDHPDPGAWLHGVLATDRSEALFCYVRTTTSPSAVAGRLRLPGLLADRHYEVVRRDEAGGAWETAVRQPPWWAVGRATGTGTALASIGLAAPLIAPEQAVLLHVRPV